MNRRRLLHAMAALPFAGAFAGCKASPPGTEKAEGTLKLILHGPFGVVILRRGDRYRVNAFVPRDPEKLHEFRFRTPTYLVGSEAQGKSYRFELQNEGLELSSRPPYIDTGFDDFNLQHIGEWEPQPEKYFVFLDLPAPDLITFMPPAEGVLLKDGKIARMPLDHVLEYRTREPKEVRLESREVGRQGPLSCAELMQEYRKHWEQSPMHRQQQPSQRKSIEDEMARCDNYPVTWLYFGVGLPEGKYSDPAEDSHGVRFFNQVLLPSFPHAFPNADARERFELQKILGYNQFCPPCTPNYKPSASPTGFRPADYQPHLQMVSSADDCKIGGIIGRVP